jgi:vanillate monooxygenase ferredoxin subunit
MERLSVSITARRQEASGIVSLELSDPDGRELPAFTAGAHIDVHIAPGVTRQYSLFNAPAERHRYCIAVLNQPQGRGGSRLLHETLHEGDTVSVGLPRNAFALAESPAHAVLVAGGIGITPMMAMAQTLDAQGHSFELHYCARTRECAAFVEQLAQASFGARVSFHFDDGPRHEAFDARALSSGPRAEGEHLYVCGPGGFMDHVLAAARPAWPEHTIHLERFAPKALPASTDQAFQVVLARRGMTLDVPPNRSILRVLHEHGVDVPASCEQGVCGTCIVGLIDGEADHRDSFLTDAEHREGRQLAVCCSRSRSAALTLDL